MTNNHNPNDTAKAQPEKPRCMSDQEKHQRKERVLTQGTPSVVRSISDAVVFKEGDIFYLSLPDGRVPNKKGHGYGLYYHDCRYLNGYEMKVASVHPSALVATAERGYMALFQLTNPDLRTEDGALIPKEQIGIEWERVLDGQKLRLDDLITFENFGTKEVKLSVAFKFKAEFEDVFAVRGLLPKKLGKLHQCRWQDGALTFRYDGADGLYRAVSIYFSEQPEKAEKNKVRFTIKLQPRERTQLLVTVQIAESENEKDTEPRGHYHVDLESMTQALTGSTDRWLSDQTEVKTDNLLLNEILNRSLRDLHVLNSVLDGESYFAAGLPWFGTLFGRDSLITSLQTLAYRPQTAQQTLQLLAQYQGTKVDDYRDEQPGKILHEMRVGEMANTGQIPQSPYYGTIDATILFLILIGEHAAWTGSLRCFEDLKHNIEAALNWMAEYGDTNGDGYIDYESMSGKGLVNQGWKDSGDAIVNEDGSLATPPIALVEVQGYAYHAKKLIAGLYRRTGDPQRADKLDKEAEDLRSRFNKDFWLDDKGFYALALQKDGKPCAVLSSNPGQALWSGIADPDKAARTIKSLLSEEMFSGWGIRTLTSQTKRFNPIAYHLGTVWPHDNSLIATGFRRYGDYEAARQVSSGIIDAAMHFGHYRLPELFAGFSRKIYLVPVHYPVACHPQAWAAGSVPYIVSTLLGLQPEGFDNCLRIVRPTLPDATNYVEMKRLRVGKGQVDLRFTREKGEQVRVEVLDCQGGVDVQVDTGD